MPQRFAQDRTVGRLGVYRRLLSGFAARHMDFVFSHQLAEAAGVTSAQVRRDLMVVVSSGSPTKGYHVKDLLSRMEVFLNGQARHNVALVGVGNLGCAILTHCVSRNENLAIVASFDRDPAKVGYVFQGCRCHAMEDLPQVVAGQNIRTAILAVPAAEAQGVTDQLASAGVWGILNFAPTHLRVPASMYVEDIDIMISLEKVAFFARCETAKEGELGQQ